MAEGQAPHVTHVSPSNVCVAKAKVNFEVMRVHSHWRTLTLYRPHKRSEPARDAKPTVV